MTTSGHPRPTDLPVEERSSPREAAQLAVQYKVGEELFLGTIVDLGVGGIGLTGPKQFPVGTEIELRFGSGSEAAVAIQARVRHCQAGKMGVAFVNVQASEQRKRFEQIKRLASMGRK